MILNGLNAQQLPFFSQYMHNPYSINPAATGINDQLNLAASFHKQWVSIPGSPSVQYISGHMKVHEEMGAGIKFINYKADRLGKTGAELTYSYHLKVQEGLNLSFGLSGLLYQFRLDKSGMSMENEDDNVLTNGSDKMFVIDATFGTYLYSDKYYVGLAIPQLVNRNVDLKSDGIIQEKQVRHYYLHGGYTFDLNPDFTLEPSLLFKFMESGLFQVDINAMLEYKKMALLGLSLRTSDAFVVQVGYRYQDFRIGYSYDITISKLKGISAGSHEILLIYNFKNFVL